jgi:hypothetical protein
MTYLALAELMRRPSAFATSVSMILFLVALFCLSRSPDFRRRRNNWQLLLRSVRGHRRPDRLHYSSLPIENSVRSLVIRCCSADACSRVHLLPMRNRTRLACSAFQSLLFLDRPSAKMAGKVLLPGALLCVVAVVHPTLIGSLAIASNDGAISVDGFHETIAFVGMLIGAVILILLRHRSNLVNINAVMAPSLGVAAVCLVQFVVFKLSGVRSAYAVKKYGFLIFTMNALVWCCLISEIVTLIAPSFSIVGFAHGDPNSPALLKLTLAKGQRGSKAKAKEE